MSAPASRTPPAGPSLFTLPKIHEEVRFGVLRRAFSGRQNSAAAHVWAKLNPGAATPASGPPAPWTVKAARADVLLPPAGDDRWIDPAVLLHAFEAQLPAGQKDLLVAIKIILGQEEALHAQWERVRAFAKDLLVARGLAVVMVLHDPTRNGARNPNDPHIHLLAPATRICPGGWRHITDLARDEAHPEIVQAWEEVRTKV